MIEQHLTLKEEYVLLKGTKHNSIANTEILFVIL